MISEFHEHFIGIEVGNKPVPAADGYFTLAHPRYQRQRLGKAREVHGTRRSARTTRASQRAGAQTKSRGNCTT